MHLHRSSLQGLLLSVLLVPAALAAAPAGLPAGVRTSEHGDGWLFTDARGMTLYSFDRDEGTPGASSCVEDCAVVWPPLAAPADAKPAGDWSVIQRADQTLQWAWRGRPLYFYKLDSFAGATFGDGADGQWHVAFQSIATPREIRLGSSTLGRVLTDMRGLTLYTSKSACDSNCQKTWQPVSAPALANGFGDWTVVVLPSGLRQWAWKGKALYRRPSTDIKPGEISGHGVEGWAAAVLEPAAPVPPWATFQASDAGELIADKDGHTVYAHDAGGTGRRRLGFLPPSCDALDCLDPQWKPFIAAADAKPVGSWTIVTLPDGRRQWAYKGRKLFINSLDQKPGDFKGIRFGGDRTWSAIMRSGEPMQGVSVGG